MGRTLDLDDGYSAEVDQIDETAWSQALDSFEDATIYQTWAYGSVRWGGGSLSHIVVKNNNIVVGIAQVTVKKIPLMGAGIAYVPWGPLWRRTGEQHTPKSFQYVVRALKEFYVREKGYSLRIVPSIIDDVDNSFRSNLEKEGYARTVDGHSTLLLDLSEAVDVLRRRLDQKWRNMLNRAERNDLTVIEGDDNALYRVFLSLQREMLQRKNYIPGVDYEEFGRIQDSLPSSEKMRIMICSCNGKPIAAVVVSALGDRGIYLLGATGNEGLNLKGSYLLQWRVVQWLKECGFRWYDLGGIDPTANPGVYHFKAGLGGAEARMIGRFEYSKGFLSSFCVRSAEYLTRSTHGKTHAG